MVKAKQLKNRGVQVVDVDFVLNRARAEFIGRAIGDAAFDAAAGQPDAEALLLWVRPGVPPATLPSAVGERPNSPPQITRVSFNMPRCLRSVSSAAIGLSHSSAFLVRARFQIVVMVPATVPDLHEAHAFFQQTPGDQHLPSGLACCRHTSARIFCGFLADIKCIRGFHLHLVSQFIGLQPRFQLRVLLRFWLCTSLSWCSRSNCLRCSGSEVYLLLMFSISFSMRSVLRVDRSALISAGKKSRPKFCADTPPGERAMKPGRFWFSLPSP